MRIENQNNFEISCGYMQQLENVKLITRIFQAKNIF